MGVTLREPGDLLASSAQTLVNTVNCRGAMGKGIAALFRENAAYAEMVADYEERCDAGKVHLGEPYLWSAPQGEECRAYRQESLLASEQEPEVRPPVRQVLNFPTKLHWKQQQSKLVDIDSGLDWAARKIISGEWQITSMAVPALGCGNGRLNWDLIRPTLQTWLRERFPTVEVELHAPPDGVGELSRIKLGWIDMAEAMAVTGKMLAGQNKRVSADAFSKAMATACFELPNLVGGQPEFFKKVRKRLVNNGVIGYERDPRKRRLLDISILLAPGPTFKTSIDWRREHGDPNREAIRKAAERLAEEIDRRVTSKTRSSQPLK